MTQGIEVDKKNIPMTDELKRHLEKRVNDCVKELEQYGATCSFNVNGRTLHETLEKISKYELSPKYVYRTELGEFGVNQSLRGVILDLGLLLNGQREKLTMDSFNALEKVQRDINMFEHRYCAEKYATMCLKSTSWWNQPIIWEGHKSIEGEYDSEWGL